MLVFKGFPGDSLVQIWLPMQETQIRPLGWEDLLEKEMETHASILAWDIPWTEESGVQYMGCKESETTERLNNNSPSLWPTLVQFSRSVVSDSLRPHELQHHAGLPVHHQLLEFTQIYVHWVSDVIQPSHPLSYPSPPAPNPSQHQGLFQWVSSSHQVAKVLEFQLQHQSFQWTPRTPISFRMDWLDLLAVQGTLKSLLQYHSSKASILQRSAFFTVQHSHPYMTTGKNIALTRWTVVGWVMSVTNLAQSKQILGKFSKDSNKFVKGFGP